MKWSATEVVGISIVNPGQTVRWDVPPEVVDRWKRRAAERGITLGEYLDLLLKRAEDTDGKT